MMNFVNTTTYETSEPHREFDTTTVDKILRLLCEHNANSFIGTQEVCMPCHMQKRVFDKRGFKYIDIDMVSDPDAHVLYDFARQAGLQATPIVCVYTDGKIFYWSGMSEENTDTLVKSL